MILDSSEVTFAHRTIWAEARGEGPDGMKAVAHVLLNRLKSNRWGATMVGVCLFADKLKSGETVNEFSCWGVGDPNRWPMLQMHPMDIRLFDAAKAFMDARTEDFNAVDPTFGATHYYSDLIAAPAWADPATGSIQTAHIGHHIFFRNVK